MWARRGLASHFRLSSSARRASSSRRDRRDRFTFLERPDGIKPHRCRPMRWALALLVWGSAPGGRIGHRPLVRWPPSHRAGRRPGWASAGCRHDVPAHIPHGQACHTTTSLSGSARIGSSPPGRLAFASSVARGAWLAGTSQPPTPCPNGLRQGAASEQTRTTRAARGRLTTTLCGRSWHCARGRQGGVLSALGMMYEPGLLAVGSGLVPGATCCRRRCSPASRIAPDRPVAVWTPAWICFTISDIAAETAMSRGRTKRGVLLA